MSAARDLNRVRDLVVPPKGHGVWLVSLSSAAMAFLAVFALALSVSSARLADVWAASLAQSATVRLSAPPEEMAEQLAVVMDVLRTTPGIASAREMGTDEQAALLEVWLGPDLPLDTLPLPRLIEVTETDAGPDRQGLRLRLAAEAPGAVYDDHTRWRAPFVDGARRMQMLATLSLALIGGVVAAMVTLAASAALASNAQVIRVLRLVGAQDRFIARAFVRRLTRRAALGAGLGTLAGLAVLLALPDDNAGTLVDLGFDGGSWALPLLMPVVMTAIAFVATWTTAFRVLRGVT
ncbi:MAG: cell division protein FtsX [Roseinatronobacter sp.]